MSSLTSSGAITQVPNISSAVATKIASIDIVERSETLIDIEVEGNHTFWVSRDDVNWVLTHNCGMADVDTDVSDRDKILDVMRDEFGFENVVPISNYNTTKLKSLTKDISKFYGIDFQEVNQATATVEMDVRKAVTKEGDDKNLFVLVYDEAMGFICSRRKEPGAKPVCSGCTDECTTPVSPSYRGFITKYPHVGESIKVLFKQNRSLGRHAGGVLVCDDLPKKMPLITSKGEPQSPWVEGVQYKHLEKIGNFVKFDILGLATLRLIERTIELILKRDGVQNPTFKDVRKWFDERMLVDRLDLDDQKVYETVYHNGAWCGIFQGTSKGAQRFFEEAKPRSIIDIAVLTSIYRPGPLAAKLNKLWIDVLNGKEYDWGDRRINDLLAPTKGLLIFQEGVMHLAEHVAGFPKDKCDEVRRAIMKRSISGGDAAKAKVDEMRSQFVDGAVANGYARDVAENVYEKIGFFSGYGFNKSHAISYAIDSYYCAYLLTHYPEQWLTSYLEFMSNNPDDRARAIGEVKGLGYEVIPIDVNHASKEWVALPGKKFMPSLLSCKGVGTSAIDELIERRPYQSIYDLLYDDDKQWAPSKFNKRALEALIKVEAFASLNCVGEGRLFASYRHMHHVLIERNAELKRTTKKDPHAGFNNLGRIAAETLETHGAEWSRKEQVENMVEIVGSVDVTRLVDPDLVTNLAEREVIPIDQLEEGQKSIVWFIAQAVTKKKTRNGKTYGLLEALGPSGKAIRLSVWGWKEPSIDPFSMYIAEVERNDFGCSTMFFRLKRVGGNQ